MRRPNDHLPAPPELPSFTIENGTPQTETERVQSICERHTGTGLVRHDVSLNEDRLDQDAARVVRRLERAGFQAYLVGGCVRDLLLGGKPKDFDIATSARPEDVRTLFRNCRIIGRRFRLAHVFYPGGKVIEVATFRRNPATESPDEDAHEAVDDLLIRSDNVFGEAHEDALRRDFTINALFYDMDRHQVLDWCNGMADVARKRVHTIGDPIIRFREDPIRILRAMKFAARLDLGIEPDVYDAMVGCREELARASRPRLFEEILRLLRGGAAHRSMWLFWEMGAMAILLPELAAFLDDADATAGGAERFWRRLRAIDLQTRSKGYPVDDVILWAVLLQEPLDEAIDGARDRVEAAFDFIDPIAERLAIPRRVTDALRRVWSIQPRLLSGKVSRLVNSGIMPLALDYLELDLMARDQATGLVAELRAQLPEQEKAPLRSGNNHRPHDRARGGRNDHSGPRHRRS